MDEKAAICHCGCIQVNTSGNMIKCLYCGDTYIDGCCIGTLSASDSPDRANNVCTRCWSFHRKIQREPKNYAWRVQTVLLRSKPSKWDQYLIKNTDFTSLPDVLRFLEYTSSGYIIDANLDHWGWQWFATPQNPDRSGMLSIGSKVFKVTVSSLGEFGIGLGRTMLEALSRAIINRELSGTRRYLSHMDGIGMRYAPQLGWFPKDLSEDQLQAMLSEPPCQE